MGPAPHGGGGRNQGLGVLAQARLALHSIGCAVELWGINRHSRPFTYLLHNTVTDIQCDILFQGPIDYKVRIGTCQLAK